jgi:hypothetical protein
MNHTYDEKYTVLADFILQQKENIRMVERKRTWRDSVKAMSIATFERRIAIAEEIGEDLARLEGLCK